MRPIVSMLIVILVQLILPSSLVNCNQILAKTRMFQQINLFNYYLDTWLPLIDSALHELKDKPISNMYSPSLSSTPVSLQHSSSSSSPSSEALPSTSSLSLTSTLASSLSSATTSSKKLSPLSSASTLPISSFSSSSSPASHSMSSSCRRDVDYVIQSAKNQIPWALKVFDSFGKPTSGIMQVDLSFLGSYSECINSVPNDLHERFSGQYCLATFQLPDSAVTILQRISGIPSHSLSHTSTKLGLCVPSSCDMSDVKSITDKVLSKLLQNTTVSFSTCYHKSSSSDHDLKAYIFLIFVFLMLGMVVMATIYDYNISNETSEGNELESCSDLSLIKNRCLTSSSIVSLTSVPSSSDLGEASTSTSSQVNRGLTRSILLAFSAKRNINHILDTSNSENCISPIHGLKVISMFWIIGGHSYSFAMQWLFFQNSHYIESDSKNVISQILANTNFSVDCFFFISGLLVAYITFKQLHRRGRLNYFQFYLHRYIRMTPLMMVIIAFCVTLLKYMGQGPAWTESITMFDKWCQDNWWINALYLHNFINRENMCLSHSWYSAVDMQLYLVSPLIMVPLFWLPFWGILLIVLLLASSMIITATLTIVNHYPPVPYLNNITSEQVLNDYYGWIYIKPWSRIGPYLIGIAIAYLIYLHNNKPQIKKKYVMIGWLLALLLNAGILLAMFPAINGNPPSDAMAGLYSATSRTLWSVGLAWVVYACVTGNGGIVNSILSWKPFIPLSKLTYSAYLIHPVVIACFYGSRETTFHFSHYLMVYFILGNITITYIISFGLSILFEAPILAIERLFR